MVLRNVVPRQGTETVLKHYIGLSVSVIEKCSSPTGDGNNHSTTIPAPRQPIEKCSSPTGDGNKEENSMIIGTSIEKCSSPTGDGNTYSSTE